MAQSEERKRAEQAEYRTKLIEAELNAVRSSKAYQISKKMGIIKAQIKSDPIGLSKKAAKLILTNPKKARHMLRSVNRGASISQSVAEQNSKYQEWILLNEPDEADLNEQRRLADALGYKPLISIVTPVFNPPLDVFEELVESVLEQTYTHFELCLGNFGDAPEIEEMIAKYASIDPRVKHYAFDKNLGIAGNSNQILEKVEGEFIALLDHDDTLSPNALYENAKLLNEKPYDFIYSDKDKIDEKGNRFDPLFKPELSPEMLLNVNYLTHLNIMRTGLVRKVGGWDPITDGAQDWDLFLRVVSEAKHIGFIPKVLYHWRVIATSTAMSIETKPYALANQCKAVDKYLSANHLPAHAYVEKTELFLRWDPEVIDRAPTVFIFHTNLTSTHRVMRRFRKVASSPKFVVLVRNGAGHAQKLSSDTNADVLSYEDATLRKVAAEYLAKHSQGTNTAIFVSDTVLFNAQAGWYEKLTGWLAIPEVAIASGRVVDKKDLILDSGGLVTPESKYFPLFYKYPRYYQSYLGNAEWVRNLSVVAPVFCATTVKNLEQFNKQNSQHGAAFSDYCQWVGLQNKRIVMTPHATVVAASESDIARMWPRLSYKTPFADPFSNPNMAKDDPLRLFDDEELNNTGSASSVRPLDGYQHDAAILADTFDISSEEMAANARLLAKKRMNTPPRSAAFFLPGFETVYAGLMNIFSFADYLLDKHDIEVTVYVLTGTGSAEGEKRAVTKTFPALDKARFVALTPSEIKRIGNHDIGIATQWATAFPLAKAMTISEKYYFIQDNEVNFYPKGSTSALAELSYKFGFTAIAGTDGLLDTYRKIYGGDGLVLKSKVDLSAYYPREDKYYTPEKPYKVFFYARPNMPRNAFELGVAGLKHLKREMGDNVEIITAGAVWDASSYGVDGMFTNLGKIEYEAVPKLYRSVDAGLMFMFSGHPGVTASELMASGCPVVVNEYDDTTWNELYEHEKTCLITAPTASEVARNLKRCLLDTKLRKKLINGGLAKTTNFYEGYTKSLDDVYAYIARKN